MIRISFPDFFFTAEDVDSTTVKTGIDSETFITGARRSLWQANSETDSSFFSCELGAASRPDHLIISEAVYLTGRQPTTMPGIGPLDVEVEGATNSAFSTGVINNSDQFDGSDLIGLTGRDIVFEQDQSGDRVYWRVNLDTASTGKHIFSKLYLGRFFLFGVEPTAPINISTLRQSNDRAANLEFTLTWEGVKQAKVEEFIEKIGDHIQNNPVFVYETETNRVLQGYKLIHAVIRNFRIDPFLGNSITVAIDFEGLI